MARRRPLEQPEAAPADYSFRTSRSASSRPTRSRRLAGEIHAAIVDLLLAGEPAPETLLLLAHHARARPATRRSA